MRFLSPLFRAASEPQPRRRPRRSLLVAGLASIVAFSAMGGGALWLARTGIIERGASAIGMRIAREGGALGLAVANLEVEGRERVPRAAILAALGVARGTPILGVDLVQAKARLEALPWVGSVAIERQLPDTIFVRLVERQPLAFWQRQGKLVLIDRDGKIIPTERLDGIGPLPVVVGEDAPAKAAELLDMIATEPSLAHHVDAAVRVGGRRWNLRFDSGIDVALPEENMAAAWHRLAALERSDGLLERKVAALDLRLPDRLVLQLPPEPQKPVPSAKRGRQPGKTT